MFVSLFPNWLGQTQPRVVKIEGDENALRVLELNDRDDPITEIIARWIIEAAQTGLRDLDSLCAMAIKDLRVP